jgi:NDP-sugar pyrophosphorylase family protein
MKKYDLTDESIIVSGHTLYRIRALRSFSAVREGDLGGWIEYEGNLSHDGDCWVFGGAKAFYNAKVFGDAMLSGNVSVHGNAHVSGDARVNDNAWICGNSKISGNCILNFNNYTYLYDVTLDHGVWTDTINIDNKKYIISNTLEQLYIGDSWINE